jgi:hypothetical protein
MLPVRVIPSRGFDSQLELFSGLHDSKSAGW